MLIKEHTKLQLSVLLAFILIFSTFASAFAAPASQFYDSETGRELTLSQVLEGIKDKSIKYENLYKIDGERYINLKELSDAEEQAILAYMTQSGKELSDIIESIKNGDQEVLNGLANLVAEETAKVEAKTKEDLTPLKIESVNAINGKVTVEFNKEVTELPEGLVVLKDGEALELEADAFVVVEGKVEITVPLIEATEEEQTIVYSVKLGEAKAVAAEAVVIPAREKTDVEKVEAMIEALPEVKDLTKEDISKVGEARDAYEKLSEEQKAQVKNYDKLDALLKEAEKIYNQDLANIVIEMIANLDPTSETFAESVATAREAYDGLTPEQKELVTNYDLLVAAEESLKSVTVVKVSAINGKITVVLSGTPKEEPTVEDFSFDMEINGEYVGSVEPTDIAWDAETNTAVLTVPMVEQTEEVQVVQYWARYLDNDGVTSEEAKFTVEVDPQVDIVAAAEEAVKAYEDAPITNAEEIATAEALEVVAVEKVELVADAEAKAGFETRIATKKAAVDAKKAELEEAELLAAEIKGFKESQAEVLALTVDTVAIENKEAVEVAIAAYEGLSDAAKAELEEEKALLDSLLVKIGELEAEKAYAELKAGVEEKVAAYEELAEGELLTQDQIEAANEAKAAIVLEGLNDADTAEFQARIDEADALVVVAQKVIDDANALAAALSAVNNATTNSEMKVAIEANAEVLELNLVDYDKFSALDKRDVLAAAVLANKPEAGYTAAANIQAEINKAVLAKVLADINKADVIDASVKTALEDYSFTLGLNLDAYNTLVEFPTKLDEKVMVQPKVLVAGAVKTSRDALEAATEENGRPEGAEADNFFNAEEVKVAFDAAVNAWVAVQDINSATESDIVEKLTEANLAAIGVDKADITKYTLLTEDRKETIGFKLLNGIKYETVDALKTAFDTALGTEFTGEVAQAVAAVNKATAETMRTVLEDNAELLGLDLTQYNKLIETTKDLVAAEVLKNRPETTGYESAAKIKEAFDAAVTNAAVIAINSAKDAAEMTAAIENHSEALGLNPVEDGKPVAGNEYVWYLQLTDKDAVAEAVLAAREAIPTTKAFVGAAAIKSAFDTAVQAEHALEAVANINALKDAEVATMRTELEKEFNIKGLNLTTTTYKTLSSGGKDAVAELVIMSAPYKNIENGDSAAKQIKDKFEAAAEAQSTNLPAVAVAAVNAATTRTQMTNALTTYAEVIGITFNEYNTLTDKNIVIDAMIAHENFADVEGVKAIKNYFEELVAVQAVNEAADAAAMKVVLENKVNAAILEIDVTTKVAEDADPANYADLNDARKLAVAQAVIDAREEALHPEEGNPSEFGKTQIGTAFGNAVTAQIAEVKAGDALAAINKAADAAAVKTIIEGKTAELGLTDTVYTTLVDDAKTAVATAIFNAKPFAKAADVKVIYDRETAVQAINAVTGDGAVASVKTLLETKLIYEGLGLDMKVYNALKESDTTKNQTAVATAVYNEGTDYTNAADIKTAFDNAVITAKQGEVLAEIIAADTNFAVKELVEANADLLGLDMSVYNEFSTTAKLRVNDELVSFTADENVLEAFVAAFNKAVANEDAYSAVLNAETAEDMKSALEAHAEALGIEIDGIDGEEKPTGYNALTDDHKLLVAKAVLEAKPFLKNEDIKTAFNKVVTEMGKLETAIAAVNEAETADAMKTALEATDLGLPTAGTEEATDEYADLSNDGKLAVALMVLENMPEDGYADEEAILAAFNAAVAQAHAEGYAQ